MAALQHPRLVAIADEVLQATLQSLQSAMIAGREPEWLGSFTHQVGLAAERHKLRRSEIRRMLNLTEKVLKRINHATPAELAEFERMGRAIQEHGPRR